MPDTARKVVVFPSAVGADQGDDFTLRNLDGNTVQHFYLAIGGVQIFYL